MKGSELRSLRLAKGWSQSRLAAEAGLGKGKISDYETGQRRIIKVAAKLFTLLLTPDAQAPPAQSQPPE